jgi:hypothetical protein
MEKSMSSSNTYVETLSSNRTEALFLALTLLFLLLFAWRTLARGVDSLAVVLFLVFTFFLFYALNYRTLLIRLTQDQLVLKFGLFTWKIPLDNIEAYTLDDLTLGRIGGAGIHFSPIRGRYRAMFNFLEYPRVVLALKEKRGLVRDIAFSTRRPQEMMRLIQTLRQTG